MILPDLLEENLKVVFCGTAPSRTSAARRAYYAHPQNKFYKTLHATGLTPTQIAPDEYPQLLSYGIGLTDVNKAEQGNDVDLSPAGFSPDALKEKILRFQPHILAFTSKRAAKEAMQTKASVRLEYGQQLEKWGSTHLYIVPSTSGAASASWDVAWWHTLAATLRGASCAP